MKAPKPIFFATFIASIALPVASFGQVTGQFQFANVQNLDSQTFTTANGFSMTASGLSSATSLDQSLSTVTLNATGYGLVDAKQEGLGTGPYSDGELRNGAGTPKLNGASLIEISNLIAPQSRPIDSLNIVMSSVDRAYNEGFLVYGSNDDAFGTGSATLSLLYHGKTDAGSNDIGTYQVTSAQLADYSHFYVTADNSHYSSVIFGNGTSIQAAPEPSSLVALATAGLGLFFRKRKLS